MRCVGPGSVTLVYNRVCVELLAVGLLLVTRHPGNMTLKLVLCGLLIIWIALLRSRVV